MALRSLRTVQLAALADVSPIAMTAWRTGRRAPFESSSRRLAAIFETEIETVRRPSGAR